MMTMMTYLDDWQSQIPPCFSKARIISSLLLYSSVDYKRSKIRHLLQLKDLIPINTMTKQINAKIKGFIIFKYTIMFILVPSIS